MDDDNKLVSGEIHRRSLSQSPLEQAAKVIAKKFDSSTKSSSLGATFDDISGGGGGDGNAGETIVTYTLANGSEKKPVAHQHKAMPQQQYSIGSGDENKSRTNHMTDNLDDDDEGLTNPAIDTNIDDNNMDTTHTIDDNENRITNDCTNTSTNATGDSRGINEIEVI